MTRDTLTGSRIRERRMSLGIRQADLAERAGISASYLNLIEHNRRRIGGKLLLDIAEALDVEPSVLTDGAGAALVAGLRAAVPDAEGHGIEIDRLDEFAGRFPGWAQLLVDKSRRVDALERTVIALTDRLSHDPHLAASLHDMLTTVTAIRSAASILAEPGEIEPEWQARFHRNINDDSARLAEISKALVQYLDTAASDPGDLQVPQEEADSVLAANGWHFPMLETPEANPHGLARELGAAMSASARSLLLAALERYANDARRLPRDKVLEALRKRGVDPFAVAAELEVDPGLAMRRIAALAVRAGFEPVGLAICDASGQLVHRQAIDAFALPRSGAGCAMLPLYRALATPGTAHSAVLEPLGRVSVAVRALAFAGPDQPVRPDAPLLLRAHMLIVPDARPGDAARIGVGVSCRICPRQSCPGRSEPSVLAGSA